MSPVIEKLNKILANFPIPNNSKKMLWDIPKRIEAQGPKFYQQIVPQTAIIQLEYSIACAQLRRYLQSSETISEQQFKQQLADTLMLCELLQHIHEHYLIVPREVARLAQQKEVLQSLMCDFGDYYFATPPIPAAKAKRSWSQEVRDNTLQYNWYRILLNRSKRFMDLLERFNISDALNDTINGINKHTAAFFMHLNWVFHTPRLLTNTFLIVKHTLPGSWMKDKERSLDWDKRLSIQLNRRWFELSHDTTWITIGALSAFLLVGGLAPVAVYVNMIGFAIDLLNITLRALSELNRLETLKKDCLLQLQAETDPAKKQLIVDALSHLQERTSFEQKRFAILVTNNVLVLAAMGAAIPLLALNPIGVFATAAFLMALWIAVYVAIQLVEKQRPKDNLEKTASAGKLGFFAKPPRPTPDLPEEELDNKTQPPFLPST